MHTTITTTRVKTHQREDCDDNDDNDGNVDDDGIDDSNDDDDDDHDSDDDSDDEALRSPFRLNYSPNESRQNIHSVLTRYVPQTSS